MTLRSVIEDMEDGVRRAWDRHGKVRSEGRALVVCSVECGKDVREIARIQRKHDYVLLASRERLCPNADRTKEIARVHLQQGHWFGGRSAIPERYLLLSEISRENFISRMNALLQPDTDEEA